MLPSCCRASRASRAACSSSSDSSSTTTSSGHVLTVGTFHGTKGEYSTIQAAVDAAKKGDWILVAPGDYKETADLSNPSASTDNGQFGGVLITTAGVHLRGMDRNTTVVDGTKAGAAQCSAAEADQQFGVVKDGKATGRNGIVVSKADNVSIDNLTVCNFLNGTEDGGNEIWWNGDLGTKALGLKGYQGSYLTATSTFYNGDVRGCLRPCLRHHHRQGVDGVLRAGLLRDELRRGDRGEELAVQ